MVEDDATDKFGANNAPVLVGMGVRVPRARNPAQMWDILSEGRCVIGTVDPLLFDPAAYYDPRKTQGGKTYSIAAGQIDDLYNFDASFFGISPREAAQMDPQQRLMLQTTWEAVEDAGLDITDLAGERTGVFIGSSIVENLSTYYFDTARGGSGFSLGNALNIIANRVSATFDFGGPSYVLDAACSSGLYALHQAVEALARDELDTAIVGAVHVIRAPGGFVGFSQARMMSPTGLCRAFDAEADGYVRSEACVAIVLQRPKVAQSLLARPRMRMLSTGVNTDGAASPLTVPSSTRQEALIDRVLERSGRDPEEFSFFEAHGTGTQVGDPVEASSIGKALAKLRRTPLLIGSAKTNFGHPEPAAGLVGLAKTVLAMEHRQLPASLHFKTPNPNIDFEDLNLEVNAAPRALPESGALVAGLNSFGFGGTNVTAIVESVDQEAARGLWQGAAVDTPDLPAQTPWLLLSAASEGSLASLATTWSAHLSQTPASEHPKLAAAAVASRKILPHRLALPLDGDAAAGLARYPETAIGVQGTGRLHQPRNVFAFAGNGAQFAGMGQALFEADPVYHQAFMATAQAFNAEAIPDLEKLLYASDLAQHLLDPLVAQPLLFACQIAQVERLRAVGILPDAVVGHSVGEIAALHVAGAFDLAGAARIIASRSRALAELRGTGTMAAVASSEGDLKRALAGLGEEALAIAAVNSPRSVTVAGPVEALERLGRVTVAGKRLAMVRLGVDVPYHSAAIDVLRDRFMADLDALTFTPTKLPVAAAALGRMLRSGECDAEYLWRNTRDTVRFSESVAALANGGACQIVEISPKSTFAPNIRDMARFSGLPIEYFLPDSQGGDTSAHHVAARAWAQGVNVDTSVLAGKKTAPAPKLPAYPWEEARHYLPLSPDGLDAWGEQSSRRLVGRRTERAAPVWMAEFSPAFPRWVADHKVGGQVVLPAAVLVEMALGAGADLWPDAALEVCDFDIVSPAIVGEEGLRIRTMLDPDTGALSMAHRPRLAEVEWSVLARGTVRQSASNAPDNPRSVPAIEGETGELYAFLTSRGLDYGPSFRRLSAQKTARKKTVWARLSPSQFKTAFLVDPTSVDAGFHGLAVLLEHLNTGASHPLMARLDANHMLLPVRVGRLQLVKKGSEAVLARVDLRALHQRSAVLDLTLFDRERNVVARLQEVEFALARLSPDTLVPPSATLSRRVRLRTPDRAVALPSGWKKPDAVLRKLGLSPTCQAGKASGPLADLRRAMSGEACFDVPLRVVLDHAPVLADDLRALMMTHRAEHPQGMALHGFAQRQKWDLARRLIEALAKTWKDGERLNILINGLPDVAVLRALRAEMAIDRIAITASTPEGKSLLQQVLPGDLSALIDENPGDGSYDLRLDLAEKQSDLSALAAGGLSIALDFPDLMPGVAVQENGGVWYQNGPILPLRLHMANAPADNLPKSDPQPKLFPIDPLPDGLPVFAQELQRLTVDDEPTATHRLLLHVHQAGDDPAHSLAALLARLKTEIEASPKPLVLICLDNAQDEAFDTLAAGLGAVQRTLANEHSGRKTSLISAACRPNGAADGFWAQLFDLGAVEPVIHMNASGLWGERVLPMPAEKVHGPAACLDLGTPGRLDRLEWVGAARKKPGPGEIEIAVAATGLNFRDVMWARGLLPERILRNGASGAGFGMECAGEVQRVGPGTTVSPGTRIMGFAPSAFASSVILPESAVMLVPEGVTLTEAAALPVVFSTAWEALVRLARLQAGETVLIHGAAGGVGLAAIQIAQRNGARVFATAGTPEKRAIARACGAEIAFDSRDLGFAEALQQATDGRGVDVVLNSLSGEAMQRSVACLAPFGRFVELGKRDFLEGTRLDLRPFAANLSYFAYDLDQRLAADPDGVAETMRAIGAAFAEGALRPLPVTSFSSEMAEDAFRHMLAARHVGKIVITPPKPARQRRKARPVRDDWIILGGTGGVGLAVAQALRAKGAVHVHLLSRSGALPLGSGAMGHWAETEENLSMHAVDGADPDALAAFFDGLRGQGRRVGGVIHAAMILRDRLLRDLDLVETQNVIRAKLGVAQNLDRVLREAGEQPDHVVFFSSVAARLGNPGQIAYSAANAAMEAIVAQRRADGLPGLAIAWGAIGDSGYLTRNATVSAQLSKMDGLGLLTTQQMIAELFAMMERTASQDYTFAAMDWPRLAPMLPALSSASFSGLVPIGAALRRPASDLAEELKTLDWPAALARVEHEIRDIVSGIMRLPPEQFDPQRPFGQYGIDSLMAMELRLEIEQRFASTLSAVAISEKMTAAQLGTSLLARIKGEGDSDQTEMSPLSPYKSES